MAKAYDAARARIAQCYNGLFEGASTRRRAERRLLGNLGRLHDAGCGTMAGADFP